MLFGEPPVCWDSFPIYSSRQGIRLLLSREEIPARKAPGYPNPILQADRVRKVAQEKPGAICADIGKVLGLSSNWVGELVRMSRLPDEVQDYVRGLGPLVLRSQITGKDLRRLSSLKSKGAQLSRFRALLRDRGLPGLKRASSVRANRKIDL